MDVKEFAKLKNREEIDKKNKHIQEKISKFSADFLELNVSQDITYWDVRQQLKQMKVNHERQQLNMVELQMQNETLSGQYQEEIRHRPEVLNKIHSTREMCDVHGASAERLKDTLLRCKADQTSICAAFNNSTQIVQNLKDSHQRAEEKYLQQISSLQETAKLTEEHQTRLLALVNQHSQATNEQLQAELNDARNKFAHANSQIAKKEEEWKQVISKMINEFHIQIEGAKNAIHIKEKSLKEAIDANAELKTALGNQEEFCKHLLDQKNELEEKIAVLEDEKISASEEIEKLQKNLEKVRVSDENAKKEINDLNISAETMRNQLEEKEYVVNNFTSEIEKLKSEISTIGEENKNLAEALKKAEEDCSSNRLRVHELVDETTTLRAIVEEKTIHYDNYKLSTDFIIQELKELGENQKEELNKKASVMAQMMNEVQNSISKTNKLQNALQLSKIELEEEKKNAKERKNKIQELEAKIKEKNIELATQTEMMQDLKNEKEQLQKKVNNMQDNIDNARVQLSVPSLKLRRCNEPADDNAVVMTPTREVRETSPLFSPSPKFATTVQIPQTSREEEINKLYDLYSESSKEDNCSIKHLQTRRLNCEEKMRPKPSSAYKRRRPPSPPKTQTTEQKPQAAQQGKFFKSKRFVILPERK